LLCSAARLGFLLGSMDGKGRIPSSCSALRLGFLVSCPDRWAEGLRWVPAWIRTANIGNEGEAEGAAALLI
jgi:hypothetical protein